MQSRQTQVLTLQVTAASGSTPSGFRDQGRVDASDPAGLGAEGTAGIVGS